jgi:hypothetical protein
MCSPILGLARNVGLIQSSRAVKWGSPFIVLVTYVGPSNQAKQSNGAPILGLVTNVGLNQSSRSVKLGSPILVHVTDLDPFNQAKQSSGSPRFLSM